MEPGVENGAGDGEGVVAGNVERGPGLTAIARLVRKLQAGLPMQVRLMQVTAER